jgi:hypothetical protein
MIPATRGCATILPVANAYDWASHTIFLLIMGANMVEYTRAERVSLRLHPELTERWVQTLVEEDPKILGLGDLELRARERRHTRAGRLDLLLQDSSKRRYEVEVQLGATDESHIIRTIEYWDIERRKYPQYEHCAVLVAEDITSRFLNVISLFNGTIPFVAIQMQAMNVGTAFTLVFTKVLDEFSRGPVDEDEDAESAPTDRAYWEQKASKDTVQMADEMLALIHGFDHEFELRYNKYYIGLTHNNQPMNFTTFRPRKNTMNASIHLPVSDDIDKKLNAAGIDLLEYDARGSAYRLSLSRNDVKKNTELLTDLMRAAYTDRAG